MSSDGATHELPTEVDLESIDAYLKSCALSDSNRTKCMRVILNLVTGRGVTHKNKSDVFLQGRCVTPHDDLEALRTEANEWLPYTRGPNCLDTSHGWCLNHPIQKLIEYKNHLLGIEAPPKKRKRQNPVTETLRQLKSLYDDGIITSANFESKKAEILGRI